MDMQMLVTAAPEVRAAQLLSFDETKAELTALAKSSERITKITNRAGRDECHSSLMVLKGRRVDIEKRGKEARDDANKFAKAVIAKEKELIGFIAPEEERLQLLRDQWDTAAEVARLEKLEAERLRVEAIQQKIQAIRDVPSSLVGKPSIIIAGQLAKLRETALDETELGADYITATDALTAAIARVEQLLAAQHEADAEKKRQAERDAEMEAMRAKMAEQQRLIDEAAAEKAERERAEQAQREAEERAERERIEAHAREVEMHIYAVANLAAGVKYLSWEACEQRMASLTTSLEQLKSFDFGSRANEFKNVAASARHAIDEGRKDAAERELVRQQEEAALQAERERQAAEQKKLDEQAAQLKRDQQAAAAKAEADRLANLGLREAAEAVVSARSNGGNVDAAIDDLAAALANDAAPAKPARTKREARA